MGYLQGMTPELEARLDKILSKLSAWENEEYDDGTNSEDFYYETDDLDGYNEYEDFLNVFQIYADDDWDALIDDYEKIVYKIADLYPKALDGDEDAYTELEGLMFDFQILELKLSGGMNKMTEEQIDRLQIITLYLEKLEEEYFGDE